MYAYAAAYNNLSTMRCAAPCRAVLAIVYIHVTRAGRQQTSASFTCYLIKRCDSHVHN